MKLTRFCLHFLQLLLVPYCKVLVAADYYGYDNPYDNTYDYTYDNTYDADKDTTTTSGSGSSSFTISSVTCKNNDVRISSKSCGWRNDPCPLDDETLLTLKGTYEISSSSTPLPTQDVTVCGRLQTSGGRVFYRGECRRVDDLCEEYVDCEKFKYVYDYDEKKAVKTYYDEDWMVKAAGEYYFVLQNLEIPWDKDSIYIYGFDVEFVVSMYYSYDEEEDRRDEEEPWRYQSLVEECTIEVTTSYSYKAYTVSTYYSVIAGVLFIGTAAAVFFHKKTRRRGTALLDDSDGKEGSIEIPSQPGDLNTKQ